MRYLFIPVLILFISCSSTNEEMIINTEEEIGYKEIYYMWTEDIYCEPDNRTPPPLCNVSMSSYITCLHPDLPQKPIKNTKYKIRADKLTLIVKQLEVNGGQNLTQDFILTEPENGFRRIYTHKIKEHSDVNRCVYKFQRITFIDEPI
jgi:hypothetical protein